MNVLIVGLGSIGRKHANALKKSLPSVKIYALRSNLNAEEVDGITNIFSFENLDALDIAFIIISNPTSEHTETICKFIKYKIPLFIEKPLASNIEIEEILSEVKNAGIKTYIACNLRFLDCIKEVKKKLSEPNCSTVNEVNVYCGSYLPDWRPETDFRKTYSANADLGGGVHIDLIHELDYLYWLFGKPISTRKHFTKKSTLQINAYDYANYLLDYETFGANITLNYYRRDPKRTFEIVFENETWLIDLLNNNITVNGNIIFQSAQKISDTYESQISYFIDVLTLEKESFNTIDNAFDVLKICLK